MNETKPLQINPLKLSQPMGALLCFLGIKNTMPLMHGAIGCASFSKVFFTRHFNDPIAIQTTAVNDITAVIDGGDYSISEAIKNITAKVQPDLVGLFTTGLTETKGDDIKGATYLLRDVQKMVYVHTPDFEGGLESGWARSIEAIIDQLVEEKSQTNPQKAVFIPNVNFTPLETEKLKEQIALFGFDEVLALPDLSESLDGHLGVKQGALSSGGISIEEIKDLADVKVVITIGQSVKKAGEKLLEKNDLIQHLHFESVGGLISSDNFYKALLNLQSLKAPHKSIQRWRKRLQDALLDTHFHLGGKKVVIALEYDQALSIGNILNEVGANITAVIIPNKIVTNENSFFRNVIVGDMSDVEEWMKNADILISNFHGERICHKLHKTLITRGFPNYEVVGNGLKYDLLHEGSAQFLFEIANMTKK